MAVKPNARFTSRRRIRSTRGKCNLLAFEEHRLFVIFGPESLLVEDFRICILD